MQHERGIVACHEPLRICWTLFSPMFVRKSCDERVDALRVSRRWQWHLDEVFEKINSVTRYV